MFLEFLSYPEEYEEFKEELEKALTKYKAEPIEGKEKYYKLKRPTTKGMWAMIVDINNARFY